MTGLIAVDAGQTGIRLRFSGAEGSFEADAPGVLTDRPLMPQLAAAIGEFCAHHGVRPDQVGVGSSGLVTVTAEELFALLADLGVQRLGVAHDATTSYLGALGAEPGVVVAAGTGVVTLAAGANRVARVDGWGYLLGDAGSGFWLGRAGMAAAMRAYDGRGEPTVLLDRFSELFPDPPAAYVELQSDERRVSRIAAFSKVVDQAAGAGDAVATRILDAGAKELAQAALAGLRTVGLADDPAPAVCALGKVFTSTLLRERFVAELRYFWPTLELTEAAGTSLDGAALTVSLPATSPLRELVAIAQR